MTTSNDITGDPIKTKAYSEAYREKFDLIDSGVEKVQPVTMFPITVRVDSKLYKALESSAKANSTTVEQLCSNLLINACKMM